MSKHLKRLAAPRTMKIHRKEKTWTIKVTPGPHSLDESIPLGLIVRDYLKLCDSYREVKRVISNGNILVDGIKRKNHKYPCGLMDVVSIPKIKKNYRILFDREGKLTLVPISDKDSEWKLCRIKNKSIVKENKMQLNLHDGRNTIVKKDEYKTGDVLKIAIPKMKIEDIFKFDKGTVSMITGGSHIGEIANIEDVQTVQSSKDNLVKMKSDHEFSTLKTYIFPIGKTKPVINLPEVKIQ